MNKRADKRITVALDAELIASNQSYSAFVENISGDGIFAKVAYTTATSHAIFNRPVNLKLRIPSGQTLILKCKEIWTEKNTANSLIERIGVKIINPPPEYCNYYQTILTTNVNPI